MATYEFNQKTLNQLLDHDDDMIQDLAKDAVTGFKDYALTVVNFTDQIEQFKQDSPESYRLKTKDLDTKRKNQHDVAMSSIDILNRIAKTEGNMEPFCDLNGAESTKDASVNRTDITNAILTWSYEHFNDVSYEQLKELGLNPDAVQKTADLDQEVKNKAIDPQEELMNEYNHLSRTNRYPMVKTEQGYQFQHFLSQEPVDVETAMDHCLDRLDYHKKNNPENQLIVQKAALQVDPTFDKTVHGVTISKQELDAVELANELRQEGFSNLMKAPSIARKSKEINQEFG